MAIPCRASVARCCLQVGESNGAQKGDDLALAGIILGFVGVLFWVLVIAFGLLAAHHCDQTGGCACNTSVGSASVAHV